MQTWNSEIKEPNVAWVYLGWPNLIERNLSAQHVPVLANYWEVGTALISSSGEMYSREDKSLAVDYVCLEAMLAALLGRPWLRWNKKRFASALDQKIHKIIMKLYFYWRECVKNGIVQTELIFQIFHPHHGGRAELPTYENPPSTVHLTRCRNQRILVITTNKYER